VRRLPLGLAALALLPFLSPAAAGEPRTDRSGDPLPDGAIARLGTVRWRHPGEATAMMFSPNGKILAATCRGGLLLWDTATGKVLRRLPGTDCGIGGPDFTPDGHTLVAQTSTGDVGFWDVPTGKLLRAWSLPHEGGPKPRCCASRPTASSWPWPLTTTRFRSSTSLPAKYSTKSAGTARRSTG